MNLPMIAGAYPTVHLDAIVRAYQAWLRRMELCNRVRNVETTLRVEK